MKNSGGDNTGMTARSIFPDGTKTLLDVSLDLTVTALHVVSVHTAFADERFGMIHSSMGGNEALACAVSFPTVREQLRMQGCIFSG
jgi:hypothetical protein